MSCNIFVPGTHPPVHPFIQSIHSYQVLPVYQTYIRY